MKNKISCLFICLVMSLTFVLFILSDIKANAAGQYANRVVDDADILSDTEENELLKEVNEISDRQKCDVVIVTVNSLDGKTATQYADDYFVNNGYGAGSEKDGVLFLLGMSERKWAICTHGYGIYAFTDAGQEHIMKDVKPYLKKAKYSKAFTEFARNCDKYIEQAHTGKPYDKSNLPKRALPFYFIPVSILIGAVISLVIMFIWKKTSLTSVEMRNEADEYAVNGSLKLNQSRDIFLYRNISRTIRQKDTDGGSSTHKSSSGDTFGGSSGSF